MSYIIRSADHHYTIHAGGYGALLPFDQVTYPGVTGILKVMDKSDALMAWASRMTAEAAVTLGGQLVPLIESVGPTGAIRALTERSTWKRDDAAALGSAIHDYADMLHRGIVLPPDLTDGTRAKVEAYRDWYQASGWTVRATEALLVNPAAGYGGTLDLLAYDRDGRTVLADLKTGKAVYREAILQLAAYAMATWLDPNDGRLYTMPSTDRHVILHVTDRGIREVEVAVGEAEREAFRACLTLYRWREATKARPL